MVNILLIFSKTAIYVWICWLQMGKTSDEVVTMSWVHALLVLGKATRFLGSSISFEVMVLRMNRLRMRIIMSGFLIWNYVFDISLHENHLSLSRSVCWTILDPSASASDDRPTILSEGRLTPSLPASLWNIV